MKMVDVTLHIDENVDHDARESMQDKLRGMDGIMAAISHDERPHLLVVEYDPDRVSSSQIMEHIRSNGVHVEMIGL